MSRTYRRRNLTEFAGWRSPLRDHEWQTTKQGNKILVWVWHDHKSHDGKVLLAQFQSDRGHGWMSYKGPSWFAREFAQVPYRARARQAIYNWMRDPEKEVCLERKPHLPYWL